jgi:hypothetical protein
MCKLNVVLGCLILVAVALLAGTAQADLITNGDFTLGGDTWVSGQPGADNWATTGKVYVETGYGAPESWGNIALTKQTWVPPGSFTQEFGTVTAGLTYTISYDLGVGAGGVAGLYYKNGSSWTPLVTNPPTTTGDWQHISLSFDALAGQTYVAQPIAARFVPESGAGWAGIDNVSVTAAPTPEPGTLVILATGLIGLLCYAWKKRR